MGALDGNVAVVTGSASGIGAAIAGKFAAEGAAVVINSIHSVDRGRDLARSLSDAIYVQADVADEEGGQRLVGAALERWGHLDILVNNAGITEVIPHADLAAAGPELWRRIFDVNVIGSWLMTRTAVAAMGKRGGVVVNITSLAGVRPTGSSIPYACSKAALNHMTRLLANALGPEVRVNAVAPGLVDTPWTADWATVRSAVEAGAPLRRSGKPEDIAQVALVAATSAYMTGEVIVVDGGLHLR